MAAHRFSFAFRSHPYLYLSMILRSAFRFTVLCVALAAVAASATGCRRQAPPAPPVATASIQLNHDRSPLGSPLDMTFRFVVASDAHFTEDYRVMVHVLDADGEMIFAFDHNPAVPTTEWKPGQTVEYARTEFVPIYPYVGEASIQLGLYSMQTQKRLPLSGEDAGQRAYKAARLQLQPQTENVFIVYKDGFHPSEAAEHNAAVEWQWTKKDATLAFKNPKKDSLLYLDVDHPGTVFKEAQQLRVSLGSKPLETFTLAAGDQTLKKIPLKAADLGADDMVELHLAVDKTYVPAQLNVTNNTDPRELGVRVFHAFVDAR